MHAARGEGARKIRERRLRRSPDAIKVPTSAIHAVLDRHGLVQPMVGAAIGLKSRPCPMACTPMTFWCTD